MTENTNHPGRTGDLQIPAGPIETEPRGFAPTAEQIDQLLDVLQQAGVELGDHDRRIVAWVANWEWSTVATIASWARRASAAGQAGAADPEPVDAADPDAESFHWTVTGESHQPNSSNPWRPEEVRGVVDAAGAGEALHRLAAGRGDGAIPWDVLDQHRPVTVEIRPADQLYQAGRPNYCGAERCMGWCVLDDQDRNCDQLRDEDNR